MRRNLLIAAWLALPLLTAGKASAQLATRASDEAAVRTAVEQYLRSHATGNGEYVRSVFHPRLMMLWVAGDTLASRTSKEYTDGFRGTPPADEAQRKRWISSVDVAGNAAAARVVLDYPTATFVDFFTLLKIDGEWKIVSKVFSSQPKTPAR